MNKLILSVLVVLTGCEGTSNYYCNDPVFGVVTYDDGMVPADSNAEKECARINRATSVARDLLVKSKMWPDFDAHSHAISVHVRATTTCWDSNGICSGALTHSIIGSDGRGWPFIESNSGAAYLTHELFHAQDIFNLYFPSQDDAHRNWEYNGRYAVSGLAQFILGQDVCVARERQAVSVFPKLIDEDLRAAGYGEYMDGWLAAKSKCR